MTPLARTMELLRSEGWTVEKTEHWNGFAKRRVDLLNVADCICLSPSKGTMLVQATTTPHINARIEKIKAEPKVAIWLAAGHGWHTIQVVGWAKRGPRGTRKVWTCERRTVAAEMSV